MGYLNGYRCVRLKFHFKPSNPTSTVSCSDAKQVLIELIYLGQCCLTEIEELLENHHGGSASGNSWFDTIDSELSTQMTLTAHTAHSTKEMRRTLFFHF